ncbi:hypothetical protein BV509_21375 [Rhodovulum sulfidophilum]|uniref:hypothetical protein n=1 Tax=Rhodovulum visakhapatnamense TaxID=364297 RepID=UPI00095182B2|nr:hypothetical protein [Rhodovulum visakhapatnamense]MBL3568880.1 hypothetical protein [Rhodovulum visakhapatnamense]OLS42292.1 hypothetical protein BV509_21375 [Rhodovulum sulfidophilum]
MMHQIPTMPTLKTAIAHIEAHGSPGQRQDPRKARIALALHGFEGPDFDSFPADLDHFDKTVPKLSGNMPALQRLIHASGISENTYRQSWRAARRLIATVTGAAAEKAERRSREDTWSALLARVDILVRSGLVLPIQRASLPALIDVCRQSQMAPRDLTPDTVAPLLEGRNSHGRRILRRGLNTLDRLQTYSRLRDLLPPGPVTPAPKKTGRLATLPLHMQSAIPSWVDRAARTQVEHERHEHLSEPLSDSARGRYRAALCLYVDTLLTSGMSIPENPDLEELFTRERIDLVLGRWTTEQTHTARTNFQYAVDLASLLARNGASNPAEYLHGLTRVMTRLQEGRAAGRRMSPKTRRFCEELLNDPKKKILFQIQHVEYYRRALETLATARAKAFDLTFLATPEHMAALSNIRCGEAKDLLRRARMFGLLAAYAAIALEGAPYRRKNLLSLRHTGPRKTLLLHLEGRDPQAVIKFPNEELKNGRWLSERGEELEAITIRTRGAGDLGPEILSFYLEKIRPLFPEATRTHCLFPPIERAHTTDSSFLIGTFDIWLAEGSAEIGLPLSSHNFRHGYCSIDINEGRRSMEDLARIMGDTVATIQRFYSWIDAKRSVQAVQQDTARRRAEIVRAREGRRG